MGGFMNKTKRKIFEIAMKLFAEKGYEATSIEEITATVGVAKGTLYYHFSSKEEIFNFLVEEGVKLLKNSIEIKIARCNNTIEKLRAVNLIQLKIIAKYENLITIVLSELWGSGSRNKFCKDIIQDYMSVIEKIVIQGMENGELIKANPQLVTSEIFALICSTLVHKKVYNNSVDIMKLSKEYEDTIINKFKA